MKLALFLALALLAACAGPRTMSLEERFQRADRSGDGKVTRAEFAEFMVEDVFARFDANKDGVVDKEEFLAAGGAIENFRRINRSGTGAITLEEAKSSRLVLERMVVPFDEADVNGDGKVTWQEYIAYRERLRAVVR